MPPSSAVFWRSSWLSLASAPPSFCSRCLWNWFLSNARYLALLIAAFELAVGLLILKGGRPTKVGILGALGFHVVMAAMFGMWPYKVPVILLIGWVLRYDFDRAFRRPARACARPDEKVGLP